VSTMLEHAPRRRSGPLPKQVSCAKCSTVFTASPDQRHRASVGSPVYCARSCWPKTGAKPGTVAPGLIFQLGAFPHLELDAACPCRKPATHLAAAMIRGTIATVPVCQDCAVKA
jgi:hypothetical protein